MKVYNESEIREKLTNNSRVVCKKLQKIINYSQKAVKNN